MEFVWRYPSPLGGMTLASDGEALTGLRFDGQRQYRRPPETEREARWLPVFSETVRWLDLYFAGMVPDFTPPLRPAGTEFRKAIWEILRTIPYGETASYGEVAAIFTAQTGRSAMSAQAVGGAVGRNPIAILIPCHRVIGADGQLTGYAAGLDKKAKLLSLECGREVCAGTEKTREMLQSKKNPAKIDSVKR